LRVEGRHTRKLNLCFSRPLQAEGYPGNQQPIPQKQPAHLNQRVGRHSALVSEVSWVEWGNMGAYCHARPPTCLTEVLNQAEASAKTAGHPGRNLFLRFGLQLCEKRPVSGNCPDHVFEEAFPFGWQAVLFSALYLDSPRLVGENERIQTTRRATHFETQS
jgi:hypothetical protein